MNRARGSTRRHQRGILAECDRGHRLNLSDERTRLLPRAGVVKADRLVGASRDEQLSVGRDANGRHRAGDSSQCLRSDLRQLPPFDRPVGTRRNQLRPIRQISHSGNRPGVSRERSEREAIGRLTQTDHSACIRCGELCVVFTEGDSSHGIGQGFTRPNRSTIDRVPQPDGLVSRTCGN